MNISHANLDLAGLATTTVEVSHENASVENQMSDEQLILDGNESNMQGDQVQDQGPTRDIWSEMCAAEAAQAEEAKGCAQQESAESCHGKRAAELKTQEGHRKAHKITEAEKVETVMAIDDSEDEEIDANLEDLLELQAMGVKVVLPARKRKLKETANTREENQVPKDGKVKRHKNGFGEPAAQSKSLSAAEGEQLQ